MPEGFEGLGGEALRDIIAYMQSVDGGKFRTRRPARRVHRDDRARPLRQAGDEGRLVRLRKDGHGECRGRALQHRRAGEGADEHHRAEGRPDGVREDDAAEGRGEARRLQGEPAAFPRRRDGLGLPEQRRHERRAEDHRAYYADGQKESIVCKNGVGVCRLLRPHRMCRARSGWTCSSNNHQMRCFSEAAHAHGADREGACSSRSAASAAPTLVAITAELADANAPLPTVPTPAPAPAKKSGRAAVGARRGREGG